jgi:Tfp pilus assembly protein PilF
MDRIEKLRTFLAEQPGDSFVQHALALEFIKLGDDHQAKLLFENLLQHNPGYVGSYYHLGKVLERLDHRVSAIQVYEAGIAEARKVGDRHAQSELQAALDELLDE